MEPRDLAALVEHSHAMLDFRLGGCSDEQITRQLPGATISSMAHIYIHAAMVEDAALTEHAGRAPLRLDARFAGVLPAQVAVDPAWDPSGFFTPALHDYVATVRREMSAWLTSLSHTHLTRDVPFHRLVPRDGTWTVAPETVPLHFYLSDMVLLHTFEHAGEMGALRGIEGGDGFQLDAPVWKVAR